MEKRRIVRGLYKAHGIDRDASRRMVQALQDAAAPILKSGAPMRRRAVRRFRMPAVDCMAASRLAFRTACGEGILLPPAAKVAAMSAPAAKSPAARLKCTAAANARRRRAPRNRKDWMHNL